MLHRVETVVAQQPVAGRTAVVAPRLMILEYRPRGAKSHVAFVGKGVVYDTGGLNIKTGGHMSGTLPF